MSDRDTLGDGTIPMPDAADPSGTPLGRSPATHPMDPGAGASNSSPGMRFPLGTVLGGRYRILGCLGRGGMGVVYRAEDLKLDQPVALKFRERGSSSNDTDADRLLQEVRLARDVAHPNVCRIYDIVEAGADQFIVMEYVDGEDLSSLLRRIGRLPGDKALDVARQLCAGLTAIHDRGILHRDLKPANIMLDGRGRVRITDFGIASSRHALAENKKMAGTPAYMAPEQIAGLGATAQSDLYALGLILHEIFTGRHPFPAESLSEMLSRRQEGLTTRPSSLVPDIDPVIQQVILRCLEPDPARRPPSIVAVAAALPGGDPLAAALAAGKTPSPETVAQAGHTGALRPRVAIGGFIVFLLFLISLVALEDGTSLLRKLPIDKPPAAQSDRAREILKRHGYAEKPAHAVGRYVTGNYPAHVAKIDDSPDSYKKMIRARPWPVLFRYRSSPAAMLPRRRQVGLDDPPMTVPGMARLDLDMDGRLVVFEVVAPLYPDSAAPKGETDWSSFFDEAGLRIDSFQREAPFRRPSVPADHVEGWVGVFPEEPAETLHVTAASYGNRPVSFRLTGGWAAERISPPKKELSLFMVFGVALFIVLGLACVGVLLIIYVMYRRGKGDRTFARRTAIYLLVVSVIGWILTADHPPRIQALGNLPNMLKSALLMGAVWWVLYLALEPLARRHWPHAIISWTRLTSGRIRDPLVGRDILIGCLLAVGTGVIDRIATVLPQWLGHAPNLQSEFRSEGQILSIDGGLRALGRLFTGQPDAFAAAALVFFLYLLPLVLTRRRLLAAGLTVLVYGLIAAVGYTSGQVMWAAFLVSSLSTGILLYGMIRFGILAALIAAFVQGCLESLAITFDLTRWYAGAGMIPVLAVVILAFYGARTALVGQPLFKGDIRDAAAQSDLSL
jgi:hypothetical protein